MKMELCNCTETLLTEIANKKLLQEDIALTYAFALESSEKPDWRAVNLAIMTRWSRSGLERVKRMAWQRVSA